MDEPWRLARHGWWTGGSFLRDRRDPRFALQRFPFDTEAYRATAEPRNSVWIATGKAGRWSWQCEAGLRVVASRFPSFRKKVSKSVAEAARGKVPRLAQRREPYKGDPDCAI